MDILNVEMVYNGLKSMLQRIGSWTCMVGKGYNRELMYQDSGLEQGDNGIATEEE